MTLRNTFMTGVACAWILVLVGCAGGGASNERGDPATGVITDVRATPRPGWVEVTWRHGGAEAYEIHRETVSGSGSGADGDRLVRTVDGEFRVFRDEDVDAGEAYRYAVAVSGGEPVPTAGDAVRPEPGRVLRVEFAKAIPMGAAFEAFSDPAGIECAAAGDTGCVSAFPSIANVTLSARADGMSWSWDGCDAVSAGACTVAMATDRTVTVSPALANTLDVIVQPSGAGVVTSVNDLAPNPPVACTSECAYAYPPELAIGLAAEPAEAEHYRFVGWAGACDGTACTVTMNGDRRVEAQFALVPPEIGSFTVSPESVEPNQSTTLAWDVSGGGDVESGELSITIEPGVGELFARTGSVDVMPTADTTYTLRVANASGTVEQSRTVSVDERGTVPTIEYFTVDEDEIDEGDKTWLRWSVSGPGDVTVTIEPGIGSVPVAGQRHVSPREDTTYLLEASNQHGTATAEVEVEVDDDDDDDTVVVESR